MLTPIQWLKENKLPKPKENICYYYPDITVTQCAIYMKEYVEYINKNQ